MLLPRELCNVARVAAKEATRYAMNGVELKRTDDGKVSVCATDGRRLLAVSYTEDNVEDWPESAPVAPDPVAGGFSAIVDRHAFLALPKTLPANKSLPPIQRRNVALEESTANGTLRAASTVGTAQLETKSVAFPDWPNVVPNGNAKATVMLSTTLLRELVHAIERCLPDDNFPAIKLSVYEPEQPIKIEAEAPAIGAKLTGVLMPITGD